MVTDDQLAARVARSMLAMDIERDYWQKATGLEWMIEFGEESLRAVAQAMLERAIDTQTSAGQLNYHGRQIREHGHVRAFTSTNGPATLGFPILLLHERNPSDRYLQAVSRQYQAVVSARRTRDGGLSAREEDVELWIDSTSVCRFLARFGKVARIPEAVDEAWRQLEVHIDHLVDPWTGLARHAWTEHPNSFSQSTFWSRGNGWLGCAIVDMISERPDDQRVGPVADVLRRLMGELVRYQDASGYWRNVLDDSHDRLETSGTLMHAYAMVRAVDLGLLDESYVEHAFRAFGVVARGVKEDGQVLGVSLPPGGPGVPFGATPFGQGFFLRTYQALKARGAIGVA